MKKMKMVKIEISATPRQFEVTNYLIKQACEELHGKENAEKLKFFGLTKKDLNGVEKLRQSMVTSFLKNSEIK